MSDNNEITAVITTEEPAVAATLDDLRYLVLHGKAGKAPRVSTTTGNWEVYDNDIQGWVDTGISASTDITPEQLAEAIEDYFDEHPIDVPTDVVLYTAQSLTPAQQEQARGNIGAGTYSKPSGGIPASDLASGVIPSVPQMATQANMSDWTSGKTVDAAVLKVDFQNALVQLGEVQDDVARKANVSELPTAVSELTNDSGYQTAQQVQTAIAAIPAVRYDAAQTLSDAQKEQARLNIDAGTYSKPSSGIPASDLASAVQTSLGKADTALQQHQSLAGYATETYVQQQIAAIPDELPTVTASDNGKVLGVVNGAWAVKSDEGGASVTVDSALSDTSENPVQNKVVKAALDGKADASALAAKQDTLTAGQNVTISGNTISADVDSAEIASNVTNWLNTNVNPVGSAVVVDSSLSVSGAAADAKVVGDKIKDVQNLRPNVVYQNTLTGTGVPSFSVSIPAGTYDLTIDGITSSDTDDTQTVVAFRNGNTAVQTKTFDRGTAISQSITFGSDIDSILVYASTSWPKSQGDTFTISGLKLSVDTKLNTTIAELKADSEKIPRDNAKISDLLGSIVLDGADVTSAQKNLPLAYLNVKQNMIYRLSAKLVSAVQANTYIYLKSSDGTTLYNWMIGSGATEVTGEFTAQNDYSGAYVSVSSSAASVEFETLQLDFDGKLESHLIPHNASVLSVENENTSKQRDVLYSADSITIKTTDSAYCGAELEFYRPAVGTVIEPVFERNVGNDAKYKIQLTDTAGASTTFYDEPVVVRANTQRVVVTLIACWGTALATGTEVTFSNVRIMSRVVDGEGDKVYTGDRIVLKDDSKLNRCGIDLWADYKVADIPTLANYKLHMNQSMTIYKGNVFLFNDGGTGCVVDYSNKEILSSFSFEPATDNHANSAQFTDIYYDSADEYPLMILSRCYGAGKDECLIYRVRESGGSFTFTLLNTISLDLETTYGMSWGVDNTSRKLCCTQHLNGNFQVTENNPFHYHVFDMPTRSEIISGTPIVLSLADAVTHMTIEERVVSQGMTVNGGVIYQGMQVGSGKIAHIWAVDPAKNRVLSRIPLTSQLEPEGVAIYDGKMYVSQKLGSDSSATNPLQIYELSF